MENAFLVAAASTRAIRLRRGRRHRKRGPGPHPELPGWRRILLDFTYITPRKPAPTSRRGGLSFGGRRLVHRGRPSERMIAHDATSVNIGTCFPHQRNGFR
ncbi:MAG: hypothetical protein CMJ27_06905 [Phycisphaerae bacterium]|nr:hypothetical protein [Phycisphaerae bacterium]OUX01433.1 MAG: hypothetical protein CBD91_04550 [Phycisphaeraceae bacterium TMED231]